MGNSNKPKPTRSAVNKQLKNEVLNRLEQLLESLETEEADKPQSAHLVINEVLNAINEVKKVGV